MGQGSTTYPKRLPTAPLFSRLRMWEEAHEKRVPIRPKPKAPGQGQRQVATVPRGETKGRAPWQAFVRGEESAARGWVAPLGRLIRQGQELRRGAAAGGNNRKRGGRGGRQNVVVGSQLDVRGPAVLGSGWLPSKAGHSSHGGFRPPRAIWSSNCCLSHT